MGQTNKRLTVGPSTVNGQFRASIEFGRLHAVFEVTSMRDAQSLATSLGRVFPAPPHHHHAAFGAVMDASSPFKVLAATVVWRMRGHVYASN